MSIPSHQWPQSRAASPPLILLNPPNPRLTLLEYDEETPDPYFAPPREFELNPGAAEFRPQSGQLGLRQGKQPVSLLEGIVIDLKKGGSFVFRPASVAAVGHPLPPRPAGPGPAAQLGPRQGSSRFTSPSARFPPPWTRRGNPRFRQTRGRPFLGSARFLGNGERQLPWAERAPSLGSSPDLSQTWATGAAARQISAWQAPAQRAYPPSAWRQSGPQPVWQGDVPINYFAGSWLNEYSTSPFFPLPDRRLGFGPFHQQSNQYLPFPDFPLPLPQLDPTLAGPRLPSLAPRQDSQDTPPAGTASDSQSSAFVPSLDPVEDTTPATSFDSPRVSRPSRRNADQPILLTAANEVRSLFQLDIQPSVVELPNPANFQKRKAKPGPAARGSGQPVLAEIGSADNLDNDEPLISLLYEHSAPSATNDIIDDSLPVRLTPLSRHDPAVGSSQAEFPTPTAGQEEATKQSKEGIEKEEGSLGDPARLVDVPSLQSQELKWSLLRYSPASPPSSRPRLTPHDGTPKMDTHSHDHSDIPDNSSLPDSPFHTLLSLPSPRLHIPPGILNPPIPDMLQTSTLSAWARTEPAPAQRQYMIDLLERLTVALNAGLGQPGVSLERGDRRFEVDIFGSVSWGGETGQSDGDLDLVVLDKAESQGYRPGLWKVPPSRKNRRDGSGGNRNLPDMYNLMRIKRVLETLRMTSIQPILHASTPIVKFKDFYSSQDCDLNVNDLGGWYNSSLILHYCMISPFVLRPIIYALKTWASKHALNDAAGAKGPATMSSYCLSLMAIAYLQHRGALPNLQEDVHVPMPHDAEDTDDPDVIWVAWSREQGIKARVGFNRKPPLDWTPQDPSLTAADALRGFFEFFSTDGGSPRFNHATQVVSVLNGGFMPRTLEPGATQRAESEKRRKLIAQGLPEKRVTSIMNSARVAAAKQELSMGKGNLGIQPLRWGECKLVVQDPFLWHKNCAGAMMKVGAGRWQETINRTHKLLESLGTKAGIDDILMGVASTEVPAPRKPRNKRRSSRGGTRDTQVILQ